MRSFFIVLLLSLASFSAIAQKDVVKFGDVSRSELTMKRYSKDTSAVAIILFDIGSAVMSNGSSISLNYKRHVRIKIFRKEAFDDWANENLFVQRGSFAKLKGVTYNLVKDSVEKTEIDDNAVFKIRFNKYIDEIKFTLPNVKEGSVIEYSYMIKGDNDIPDWQFQYNIPVLLSQYSVDVPNFLPLRKIMNGTIPISDHKVKNRMETWTLKDIPAFKPEPLMPNKQDYISRIDFYLSGSSWSSINRRLWDDENFGGTITGFPFLKKTADALIDGVASPKQRIIDIVEYMKANVEWNGVEDIYADDLKEVFRKKKGSAADINLALASLLHKAGIPVEMVLLSTRGNGFARVDFPSTRQFDYTLCVAYVDSVGYLLDATEKYLPWNVLPQRCLNGIGFGISEHGFRWVDIISNIKSKTAVSAELTLTDAGELHGRLSFTRDGYAAYEMRTDVQKKGKESYLNDFAKKNTWTVLKSKFQDLDDICKPAAEIHEISIQEHGTSAGDFIYIDPFITFKEIENPFKEEIREFPIDFGVKTEKVYLSNITIPDGYIVDEVPQTKVMALPGNMGKFTYVVTQIGNRITVVSNIQINERIFMQDQYPYLRELYSRIVSKHSEQIVLKKR